MTDMSTYISDKFQGDIQWDFNKVKIVPLDIECECEDGLEPMLYTEKSKCDLNQIHSTKRL